MKQYFNKQARCISASETTSLLADVVSGEHYYVDNVKAEKYTILPDSIWDGNKFHVGAVVYLCGITYDDGNTVWVPDQSKYPKKNAGKCQISLGTEHSSLEFKRSLLHVADRDIDDPVNGNKPAQYKVIAREIAGMVTAHSKDAEVIIGCDDHGHPVGLNEEVTNCVAAESDLRNYLSQSFNNISFVSSLAFKWETIDGNLILRICLPEYHGDIIMVGQTEVYYRNGSNTTRVKGAEMLNIIRNYNR